MAYDVKNIQHNFKLLIVIRIYLMPFEILKVVEQFGIADGLGRTQVANE